MTVWTFGCRDKRDTVSMSNCVGTIVLLIKYKWIIIIITLFDGNRDNIVTHSGGFWQWNESRNKKVIVFEMDLWKQYCEHLRQNWLYYLFVFVSCLNTDTRLLRQVEGDGSKSGDEGDLQGVAFNHSICLSIDV